MKVNDIVCYKDTDFGKVVNIENSFVTVAFSKTKQLKIPTNKLEVIDEKIVNFFVNKEYKNDFSTFIYIRGLKINDINIEPIHYSNNHFKAVVYGSDDYYVDIEFNTKGKVKYHCDCPYSFLCKHEVAIANKISTIFINLNNLNIPKLINGDSDNNNLENVKLSQNLISFVDNYQAGSYFYSKINNVINEIVEKQDYMYFLAFYKYVFDNVYSSTEVRLIASSFGYNDKLRLLYFQNINYTSRAFSNLDMAMRNGQQAFEHSRYNSTNIEYLFYNQRYEKLINIFLQYNVHIVKTMLDEAVKNITLNEEIIQSYIDYVLHDYRVITYPLESIFNQLNESDKLTILKESNVPFKIKYEDIFNYETDNRIALVKYISNFTSCYQKVLNDLNNNVYDDPKLKASLLIALKKANDYNYEKLESSILKEASKLNNKYLTNYLRNLFSFIDVDNLTNSNNINDLTEYFSLGFFLRTKSNFEYSLFIKVYDLLGNEAVTWTKTNESISCTINNFTYKDEDFTTNLFNLVYSKLEPEFSERIEELNQQKKQQERKQRQEKLLRSLDAVTSKLDSPIVLADNHKAHLEYNFSYSTNQMFLSCKVGITKNYIIKNMYSFLGKFKENIVEKYGKNLILTHDLNNFEDVDKQILHLLTLFTFTKDPYYGVDPKYLEINDNLFNEIIHKLKGSTITFNNKPYKVTLDYIDSQINIDENYQLTYSLENQRYNSIVIGNYVYVFDNQTNTIDCFKCSYKEQQLYKFVIENNNAELDDNTLEPFKNSLYCRFPGKINVAEELKPNFKLSQLQINAYFDYENKEISVKNELKIDDTIIEENRISKTDDLNKISIYKQLLSNIGFRDNLLTQDGDILNFFSMDLSNLKDYCNVYLSDSIKNKQIMQFKPGNIRISYDNDLLSALLQESEYSDEELDKIIKAIRRKKHFIELKGERIINLDNNEAKNFVEAIDDVGLDQKHLSQQKQITMINALKGYAHLANVKVDKYLEQMVNDIKNFKQSDIKLPQVEAELRNYQKDGYRWLKTLSNYNVGGILADDMGLGKTIQIITLIAADTTKMPNLIVCPKSLVFNWKNEFNRFAKNEEVYEIYGNKEERKNIINQIDMNKKATYITSYDSLRNDLEYYQEKKINNLVIDEAHYIKNVIAQKTEAVKQVEAIHKFALTGTPIENNIIDLWSIFDFIMPGYLDKLSTFKSNYDSDEYFTEVVKKKISPFILRRTKTNVLKDLPEKYETIITCEMEKQQQQIYDAEIKQAKKALESSNGSFDILPVLTKLRQICVDPKTYIDNYTGQSCKMNLLLDLIKQYTQEGHKILIFSQFVKALNIIEDTFKENQIDYFIITGKTDGKERIEIADKFNSDSKEQVCLISLKAGGTGLNLIGADVVIHLDPWWNVSAENQATDRTHRIGQKRNVEVIKLIVSDSIEQKVIELQNKKKELIDKLISNDDQSITNITLDDIKFILN